MCYKKLVFVYLWVLIGSIFIASSACEGLRDAVQDVVSSIDGDGSGTGSGTGTGSGSGTGTGTGGSGALKDACPAPDATNTPPAAQRLFIINGGDSNDRTWESLDGTTWTKVTLQLPQDNSFLRNHHTATLFKDEIYVIGGDYGGIDGEEIYKSSDGKTWNKVVTTGTTFGHVFTHQAVVFKDKLYVIGGTKYDGQGTKSNEVWRSSNGTAWTNVTPTDTSKIFPVRANHQAVVFNGAIYVIGGDGNNGRLNDVWKSTNGAAWEKLTPTDRAKIFSERSGHQAVVFKNNIYVMGGDDNSGTNNEVWKSCNGKDWEKITTTTPFTARSGHKAAVFKDELYVIMGGTSDVWKSSNAVAWSKVTVTATPAFNDTLGHAVVAK